MEFINRLRNAGFPEDEDIADEKLNDAVDLAVEGGVYAYIYIGIPESVCGSHPISLDCD